MLSFCFSGRLTARDVNYTLIWVGSDALVRRVIHEPTITRLRAAKEVLVIDFRCSQSCPQAGSLNRDTILKRVTFISGIVEKNVLRP